MELPSIQLLESVLNDKSEPITKRMRALFYLRTIGTDEVVPVIIKAFDDFSLLLQHEICYVLGQIGNPKSVEFLLKVLADENNAAISRHEAAEAIAAIGDNNSILMLEKYASHPNVILSETCQLALDRLNWLKSGEM
jgi:deoxyhypusine monooxygenase